MPDKVLAEEKQIIKVWSYAEKVFVELPENGNTLIEIYNLQGIKVVDKYAFNKGIQSFSLNNKGVFIVRVNNNKKQSTSKIIIR
jgi:hypothetical protein